MVSIERLAVAFAVALLCGGEAHAQHRLAVAPAFGDHMVLQRGVPLPVWGTATPGSIVEVRLGSSVATAEAGPEGNWAATLDAQAASSEPRTLDVRNGDTVTTLTDVLVGEVWICAGQSNMAFPLSRSAGFEDVADDGGRPRLRLFDRRVRVPMGGQPFTDETLASLADDHSLYASTAWERSTRETAAAFSAVAWTFGARIEREVDVPVGLVHVAVGGSPIESWLPRAAMAKDDRLRPLLDEWLDEPRYPAWPRERARLHLSRWIAEPGSAPPRHPFQPGVLFEDAIAPLRRLPVRGVLWYQGESNATVDGGLGRPVSLDVDEHKIETLVASWRRAFDAPRLPFLMVQLPGLNREWPIFREAQARVARADPDVHLAVTIDLGDPTDVHPRRKGPVGERLARLALDRVLGHDLVSSGPTFVRMEPRSGGGSTLRFESAAGLRTSDGEAPRGFAVSGDDRVFWPAEAMVEGETVVLTCASVGAPVAVRHAWGNDPDSNLVNGEGLPAAPFRSDDWPLGPKIRVACIGDSITYGTGLDDRRRNAYPVRLAARLGPDYEVRNFGRAGAGVVRRSMRGKEKRAYVFSAEHRAALAWEPDVVVSNLGINDVMDWERYGISDFARDYVSLIESYQALATEPEILVWTPLAPLFEGHRDHGDPDVEEIHAAIADLARPLGVSTLDLAQPLLGLARHFPDRIHPDDVAAERIAETVSAAIRARGLGRAGSPR